KDFFNDEVSFPTKLNDLINESKRLNDGQLEHLLAIIKDLKTT
ncbi:MAG TPA: XRE family transcriptional regulator, partial [Desulfosporosinus sp.]|nr:XRE family transcriptional regulator [Desulfosporosinus sp.]